MSLYKTIKDVGKRSLVTGGFLAMIALYPQPISNQNESLIGNPITVQIRGPRRPHHPGPRRPHHPGPRRLPHHPGPLGPPPGCFIATAVYGDVNAPQVQALKDFRDNVLMQNEFGREIVDFYYSGAGENVANFIKTEAPFTIPLIRKGLDELVEYQQTRKTDRTY